MQRGKKTNGPFLAHPVFWMILPTFQTHLDKTTMPCWKHQHAVMGNILTIYCMAMKVRPSGSTGIGIPVGLFMTHVSDISEQRILSRHSVRDVIAAPNI